MTDQTTEPKTISPGSGRGLVQLALGARRSARKRQSDDLAKVLEADQSDQDMRDHQPRGAVRFADANRPGRRLGPPNAVVPILILANFHCL